MNNDEKRKMKTIDLAYIALCVALMAVCSWINIPTIVPFTLQTFAVFCTLELIGGKRGTISVMIYIVLAAIGVPVLAGFSGGLGVILGVTGGYIIGFIFMGLIYWLGEKMFGSRLPVRIAMLVVGLVVCYAFGTGWFMVVYAGETGPVGLWTALGWCVFPFIIPDIAKLALAVIITSRIRKLTIKHN